MSEGPESSGGAAPWLERRWHLFVAAIVVLGVSLRIETLQIGFLGDDWMQIAMMKGVYPGERHALDLYMFVANGADEFARHQALGTLPWWTDPALHGGVFRPLCSALLWLDHALAPMNPAVHHGHSLLWWGLVIVAAAAVFRRALSPVAAAVALSFFAVDDGVTMNIGWLANRCTLVCATFAFGAVWAHLRWREDGWGAGRWVAAGATMLAVLAGEYGMIAAAYVAAYEILGRRGQSLRAAAVGMSAVVVPVGLYLMLHQAFGYGTYGAEVYADPVHAPLGYLGWVVQRVPMLTSELVWSLPAATGDAYARPFFSYFGAPDLDHLGWWTRLGLIEGAPTEAVLRQAHVRLATVGLVAAVALSVVTWRKLDASSRQSLRWLVPGALLGLLPICVAPAHGRLLLGSQLGAAAALGALTVAAVGAVRNRAGVSSIVVAAIGLPLALVHAVLDPAWSIRYMHEFADIHDRIDGGLRSALDRNIAWEGKDAIVISARDQTTALHAELALSLRGLPSPRTWHVLSMALHPHLLRRTGPRTLELSTIGGAMITDPPELFFRPSTAPLQPGDVFEAGVMTARVLRTHPEGGVQVVEFNFVADLDDPRWILLSNHDGVHPLAMPEVGGTTVVRPTWVAE